MVAAVVAWVFDRRRHRREIEDREAEFEERIRDLRERQTAQVQRLERERDRIERTGHLQLADDLLDVLDDFDNALASYDELADEHREGLKMMRRKLRRTLEQHGIDRIEPSESEAFDPEIHEALRAVDPDDAEPGTVVKCHRLGYRFGERVLRPAAVDVAVGRDADEPEADSPEEADLSETGGEAEGKESHTPEQAVETAEPENETIK